MTDSFVDADRRFTLLDAMALVAIAAFGIAISRALNSQIDPFYVVAHVGHWLFGGLVAASLGLLALAVRRPRPALGPLMEQPGAAACLGAALALAVTTPMTLLHWAITIGWHGGRPQFLLGWAMNSRDGPAFAIVALWVTLALTGRWRPRRNWLDRLGRLVGLGWMVMYLGQINSWF